MDKKKAIQRAVQNKKIVKRIGDVETAEYQKYLIGEVIRYCVAFPDDSPITAIEEYIAKLIKAMDAGKTIKELNMIRDTTYASKAVTVVTKRKKKIVQEELNEKVFDYMYKNLITYGYVFHAFNSTFAESIIENGLDITKKAWEDIKIEQIDNILKKYGVEDAFSDYKLFSKDGLALTSNFAKVYEYAKMSPAFFTNLVCNIGGEEAKLAIYNKDLATVRQIVKNYIEEKKIEEKDAEAILNFVDEKIKYYFAEKPQPAVALVERNNVEFLKGMYMSYFKFLETTNEIDADEYSIVSYIFKVQDAFNDFRFKEKIKAEEVTVLKLPEFTASKLAVKEKVVEKEVVKEVVKEVEASSEKVQETYKEEKTARVVKIKGDILFGYVEVKTSLNKIREDFLGRKFGKKEEPKEEEYTLSFASFNAEKDAVKEIKEVVKEKVEEKKEEPKEEEYTLSFASFNAEKDAAKEIKEVAKEKVEEKKEEEHTLSFTSLQEEVVEEEKTEEAEDDFLANLEKKVAKKTHKEVITEELKEEVKEEVKEVVDIPEIEDVDCYDPIAEYEKTLEEKEEQQPIQEEEKDPLAEYEKSLQETITSVKGIKLEENLVTEKEKKEIEDAVEALDVAAEYEKTLAMLSGKEVVEEVESIIEEKESALDSTESIMNKIDEAIEETAKIDFVDIVKEEIETKASQAMEAEEVAEEPVEEIAEEVVEEIAEEVVEDTTPTVIEKEVIEKIKYKPKTKKIKIKKKDGELTTEEKIKNLLAKAHEKEKEDIALKKENEILLQKELANIEKFALDIINEISEKVEKEVEIVKKTKIFKGNMTKEELDEFNRNVINQVCAENIDEQIIEEKIKDYNPIEEYEKKIAKMEFVNDEVIENEYDPVAEYEKLLTIQEEQKQKEDLAAGNTIRIKLDELFTKQEEVNDVEEVKEVVEIKEEPVEESKEDLFNQTMTITIPTKEEIEEVKTSNVEDKVSQNTDNLVIPIPFLKEKIEDENVESTNIFAEENPPMIEETEDVNEECEIAKEESLNVIDLSDLENLEDVDNEDAEVLEVTEAPKKYKGLNFPKFTKTELKPETKKVIERLKEKAINILSQNLEQEENNVSDEEKYKYRELAVCNTDDIDVSMYLNNVISDNIGEDKEEEIQKAEVISKILDEGKIEEPAEEELTIIENVDVVDEEKELTAENIVEETIEETSENVEVVDNVEDINTNYEEEVIDNTAKEEVKNSLSEEEIQKLLEEDELYMDDPDYIKGKNDTKYKDIIPNDMETSLIVKTTLMESFKLALKDFTRKITSNFTEQLDNESYEAKIAKSQRIRRSPRLSDMGTYGDYRKTNKIDRVVNLMEDKHLRERRPRLSKEQKAEMIRNEKDSFIENLYKEINTNSMKGDFYKKIQINDLDL